MGVFQRPVILKKNSSTTFSGNFTHKTPSRSSIESSFRFSVCAHAPSMEPTANHTHVKMCKQNMLLAKAGESEFTPLSKVENGWWIWKWRGRTPPTPPWKLEMNRTWKLSFSRFHSSNLGGVFLQHFSKGYSLLWRCNKKQSVVLPLPGKIMQTIYFSIRISTRIHHLGWSVQISHLCNRKNILEITAKKKTGTIRFSLQPISTIHLVVLERIPLFQQAFGCFATQWPVGLNLKQTSLSGSRRFFLCDTWHQQEGCDIFIGFICDMQTINTHSFFLRHIQSKSY